MRWMSNSIAPNVPSIAEGQELGLQNFKIVQKMNRITKLQFSTSACLLAILCCVLFFGCKPEPEFYINGKPFYTRSRCVESKTETNWEYHYGYNMFRGKWEYYYGPHTKTECVQSVIDTVEIK